MRKELERKLEEAFPFMKREQTSEEQEAERGIIYNLYGAYGCELNDGWFPLLWNMCEEITALYEEAGEPIDITPLQVKEKFGSLHFYFCFETEEERIRFKYGNRIFDRESTPLHEAASAIVKKWAAKSEEVCEDCGKPGHLRDDLCWISTLCDECYEEHRKHDRILGQK